MNTLTPLTILNARAAHVLEAENVTGWYVRINPRLRTVAGKCRHGMKQIEMSAWVMDAPEDMWMNTLLHECAHAIAGPYAKHGALWKSIARKIGATPERCYDSETATYNRREVSRVFYRCAWPLDGACEYKGQREPRRRLDDVNRFRCKRHGLTFRHV